MRPLLLWAILIGFSGLGAIDLSHGKFKTGVASLALAAANYLLLV